MIHNSRTTGASACGMALTVCDNRMFMRLLTLPNYATRMEVQKATTSSDHDFIGKSLIAPRFALYSK